MLSFMASPRDKPCATLKIAFTSQWCLGVQVDLCDAVFEFRGGAKDAIGPLRAVGLAATLRSCFPEPVTQA